MSTQEQTLERVEITYPSQYDVIFFNDDETPMVFVIQLLIEVFGHSMDQAKDITMMVHEEGRGVAGTYSRELATQKVSEVTRICQHHGYPLKVKAEKNG